MSESVSKVQATSTSPEISKIVNTEVQTAVIMSLKVEAPTADIESDKEVMEEQPSAHENRK